MAAKEKIVIKTPLNLDEFKDSKEVNDLPSMTDPTQALTIREILVRHTRGIPVNARLNNMYTEDELLPNPKTLDYSDIESMRRERDRLLRKVKETEQAEQAAKKLQEENDKKDQIIKEYRAQMEAAKIPTQQNNDNRL